MALKFGAATTDRVDHGAGFLLAENFTVLQWNFPTSDGPAQNLWWQSTSTARHNAERKFADTNDYSAILNYATINGTADTLLVDRPLNVWKFIAISNLAGDGGPRIFHGDQIKPATEATYSARVAGVGAFAAGAGSFVVGNNAAASEAFVGDIANTLVFNRTLRPDEIQWLQNNPQLWPGLQIWAEYATQGGGIQPDKSGNRNNGAVTGALISAHPYKNPYAEKNKNQWRFAHMPVFVVPVGMFDPLMRAEPWLDEVFA